MNKIIKFLNNMHIGHVFIGIISLIFISGLFLFLFGWKKPLSLNNDKTLNSITLMLKDVNPDCEFTNLSVHTVVFTDLIDTILVSHPHLKGEIEYKTKTVFYDKISRSDTVTCATIFELENGFLVEKVGGHVYTKEHVYRHF